MAESDQSLAHFGNSVSGAGDVNGDGYADVIVGAQSFGNDQANEGRAFVYHGSAAGLSVAPTGRARATRLSPATAAPCRLRATSMATATPTFIVGATNFDNGQTDEGRAFVYHGSAAGLGASPNWTAESDQAGAFLGSSVSAAVDVNGDGYADVIVGARLFDNGQTMRGEPSCTADRLRASAPAPIGRPKATRPAPTSVSPCRVPATSTATATPT